MQSIDNDVEMRYKAMLERCNVNICSHEVNSPEPSQNVKEGGHFKCSCYDTTNLWRFWRSHYKSSKYYKPLTIKFDDGSEMTL